MTFHWIPQGMKGIIGFMELHKGWKKSKQHSMHFQKEKNEFMKLNGMAEIKGIQWNIIWKESKGFANGVLMEF